MPPPPTMLLLLAGAVKKDSLSPGKQAQARRQSPRKKKINTNPCAGGRSPAAHSTHGMTPRLV